MTHTNRSLYTLVGVFMILMAVVNVIPYVSTWIGGRDELQPGDIDINAEIETSNELNQDIGGPTTPMGIMSLVHAPVLLVIGIALLMGKRWEMFAFIALIVDALVKGANMLSQLATGDALGDALVPVLFVMLDVVAALVILQQWRIRRRQEGSPVEPLSAQERTAASRQTTVSSARR